jgi:hypothetical protein
MTLRDTTAIALAGWYLIAPPANRLKSKPTTTVDRAAPMSVWKIEHSFDTAAECEKELAKWRQVSNSTDRPAEAEINRRLEAICVATDDPRLSAK